MFNNIAKKIKVMAKVIFWGGIAINAFAIVMTISTAVDTATAIGASLVTLATSVLIYLAASLLIYGIGQLIENSDILVELTRKKVNTSPSLQDLSSRRAEKQYTDDGVRLNLSLPDEKPQKRDPHLTYGEDCLYKGED